MYYYGEGVSRDYSEALRWFRRAADQGEANAECSLGSMTYHGRGVQQDDAVAANLFRRAADQGLARAEYDLGYCITTGKGLNCPAVTVNDLPYDP
jgi:TPR repeat protein